MEAKCAKTIRDNLEQVKSYGIKIADENKSYEGYTKNSFRRYKHQKSYLNLY